MIDKLNLHSLLEENNWLQLLLNQKKINFKQDTINGYQIYFYDDEIEIVYSSIAQRNRALLALTTAMHDVSEISVVKDLGVMVDCSRNAVPKISTLKKFIRYISFMGYTFLGLYMEDTLKIDGEPYIGYQRGAYTTKDIQELDSYAQRYGIELRPYVQTLAHLNQIVRYEEYQKMIDVDDILLVGSTRTHAYLENLFATLDKAFHTRKINIGMDEAFMLGLGKYLTEHGYQNRLEIMNQHLQTVREIASKYNFELQMWSDMFFRLAANGSYYNLSQEQIQKIKVPEGVHLAYWDYYSTDVQHYAENLKLHRKLSPNISFVGGAWKWTGFIPHNRYSIHACKAAIQACVEHHIDEIAFAGWADDGAEASLFAVLPTLFVNANEIYGNHMSEKCFEVLTGISLDIFLSIDEVNPCTKDGLSHNNASKYFLYNDLLQGTFDSVAQASMIREIQSVLPKISNKSIESSDLFYYFKTVQSLIEVLELKLNLGNEIYHAYKQNDLQALHKIVNQILPELIKRIETFYEAFKRQWHLENRNQGFEVQTIRLGGLKQRVIDVREQLLAYQKGEITKIDELEEQHLDFHYFDDSSIERLNYNLWSHIVSTSKL